MLPKYQVTSLIGRGGMGAVYLGRQDALDRPVAIKILPPGLEQIDPAYGARFRQEAMSLAKLNHPGIVAVYDFGRTEQGLWYIVMEYVDGTDVSRMLEQQGRVRSKDAMAITAHVCDALAYAHARGIIHRDIKPANILIGTNGVVKVADFGLAKTWQAGASSLTISGHAMGTPHYIAPEALVAEGTVDARADVYALGVMLYHMLTGDLPRGLFEPASHKINGLDSRFDPIITQALKNDPAQRYQGVEAMRRDLDALLTRPVVKVDPDAAHAPAALNTVPQPRRQAPPAPRPFIRPKPGKTIDWGFWLPVGAVVLGLAAFAFWKHKPISFATQPQHAAVKKSALFTNSLGMKFVPLPEAGVSMCVHETRKQDYAAFAAAVAGINNAWRTPVLDGIPASTADDHPVVNVSGYDAEAFCRWLSQKEKRVYRLPSWREWSLAVGVADLEKPDITYADMRLVVKGRYPWGTEWPPPPKAAGNIADVTLLKANPKAGIIPDYDDGHATTAPVMSYAANELGIFDLAGNVTEWVSEFVTKHDQRKLRGSSWTMGRRPGEHQSSSPGDGGQPLNLRWANIGFRCVMEETIVPDGDLAKAVPMSGEIVVFSGHRYQVVGEACSWSDAAERARKMGGHLATITSAEEARFVTDITRPHLLTTWSSCWLGAARRGIGSKWQWITGETFDYQNWAPGEPNSNAKDASLVIWRPDGNSDLINWDDAHYVDRINKTNPNRGFVVEWDDVSKMPSNAAN